MGFDEDGRHLSRKCTLHSSATVKKPERRDIVKWLFGRCFLASWKVWRVGTQPQVQTRGSACCDKFMGSQKPVKSVFKDFARFFYAYFKEI